MAVTEATRFEMMLMTAAREIGDGQVLFAGFHWPMIAVRIARRLHAPRTVVVYENGMVEDRSPALVPTSPCDLVLADEAVMFGDALDGLYMFLGAGRVDLTLLEAAIVDRFGNINTTCIGPYGRPAVRLPGSGGATELASLARNLLLVSADTDPRRFPEHVDYITSPGYLTGGDARQRLGYKPGTGPRTLVTPLGKFGFHPETRELYLEAFHPGVRPEEVQAGFGWPIRIPPETSMLPGPTPEELGVIREELEAAREREYILPKGEGRR